MLYEYVDNYRTTLTAAVGSTDDTLSVDDSSALDSVLPSSPPSNPDIGIPITIAEAGIDNPTPAQVEHMVAIAADAGTIHVERDGNGTWDSGDAVGCRLTSGALNTGRFVRSVPPSSPGSLSITIKTTQLGWGATGAGAIAIGAESRASENGAVAIGDNAECRALDGIAIGSNAFPTSEYAVSIGHASEVSASDGVALGYRAQCLHANSVAIGGGFVEASATTAPMQVMIGDRDLEITDSDKGVVMQSPNGTRWRVTIDDNGDLQTTSL